MRTSDILIVYSFNFILACDIAPINNKQFIIVSPKTKKTNKPKTIDCTCKKKLYDLHNCVITNIVEHEVSVLATKDMKIILLTYKSPTFVNYLI